MSRSILAGVTLLAITLSARAEVPSRFVLELDVAQSPAT